MTKISYKMRKPYLIEPLNTHLLCNFKGEIYEYYAYSQILEKTNRNINIVEGKTTKKGSFGNFKYDIFGQIRYFSDNVDMGEFDILGFDETTIYYWEITMMKNNHTPKKKKIQAKKELLEKIFPTMKIKVIMVLPEKSDKYNMYEQFIVKLPDFSMFIQKDFYEYNEPNRTLATLKQLSSLSTPYHYYDELYALSKKYFHNIKELPKQNLIERLYDTNSFYSEEIRCYHIERKKFQTIRFKGRKMYKDNKKVESLKKTFLEVKNFLNRLGGLIT